jgi:YHS domain-containing protein
MVSWSWSSSCGRAVVAEVDRKMSDTLALQEDPMAVDPVCKMTVDENHAAGQSEYNGKTYYFCAAVCKARFDREPAKYVTPD